MGDHRRLTDRQVKRFYNSRAWQYTRLAVLARDHHRCCDCGGLACSVHHVQPVRTHPQLGLKPENLRTLCLACHGRADGGRGTPSRAQPKKANRFTKPVIRSDST